MLKVENTISKGQKMDSDRISDREEQMKAETHAEQMAEAGLVDCPRCGEAVPEDKIERCRCGKRICPKCGTISKADGVGDELFCGSTKCELAALEAALHCINAEHDLAVTQISKRIDQINAAVDRESVDGILFRLDIIRQGFAEHQQPGNVEIIQATMDMIRKLAKIG